MSFSFDYSGMELIVENLVTTRKVEGLNRGLLYKNLIKMINN